MNVARKYGKLAPHPEDTHPRVKLAPALDATLVVPPVVDWFSRVTDWPMYLNDRIGDCTIAAAGHIEEAASAYGTGTTVKVTNTDVLKAYSAVSGYDPATGANDDGAVMQDVLDYWRKTGIGGHTILGFAQVDHTNPAEMALALYLFGHLYLGIQVPQSAEDQFAAGQPWDYTDPRSPILGGHAINVGGFDARTGRWKPVSWGKPIDMTQRFVAAYADEAWIVITREWWQAQGGDPEGVDLTVVGGQYTALTRQPFPVTPPAPTPTPTPGPVPGPGGRPSAADVAFMAVMDPYVRTRRPAAHIAAAYKTWKTTSGFGQ